MGGVRGEDGLQGNNCPQEQQNKVVIDYSPGEGLNIRKSTDIND